LYSLWYADWGQPSLQPNGYWGKKRLVPEADHSVPFNAKTKNDEAMSPLSHMLSWHVYAENEITGDVKEDNMIKRFFYK
jgi:hypothetical protein